MAFIWNGQAHKMGVFFVGEKAIEDGGKLPKEIEEDARFKRWLEAGIVVDEKEAKKIAEAKAKKQAEEIERVNKEMAEEAKKPGRPKRVQR